MDYFPYEIVTYILKFLSTGDCITLSQTCKRMRIICLEYLTKYDENNSLNSILKKMKKYNFYDYYILDNKQNNHIEIFFKLYELKAEFSDMHKKTTNYTI